MTIKTSATIVKKENIFKYLEKLRKNNLNAYILDFNNFDDFLIEIKYNLEKKGIQFHCMVQGKGTYTEKILNEDFNLLSNEDFFKLLKEEV